MRNKNRCYLLCLHTVADLNQTDFTRCKNTKNVFYIGVIDKYSYRGRIQQCSLHRFQANNLALLVSPYALYNLHVASTKLHMRVLSTTSNLQTLTLLSATGKWVTFIG